MRQIKFRGRYVGDYVMDEYIAEGTMLYGGYVEIEGKPYIIPKDDTAIQVTPESVAQLIGIDANGREVYEGDMVIRIAPSPDWEDGDFNPEKAHPMAATFEDYAAIRDEEIILVVKDNGRTDKNTGGRTA